MSEIILTGANFEDFVLNSQKPVLVDFWAVWCGPCQMIAPIVSQIAEENPDIAVGKVNVDEEQGLAVKFGIEFIPTLMLFVGGELKDTLTGYVTKENILKMLDKHK